MSPSWPYHPSVSIIVEYPTIPYSMFRLGISCTIVVTGTIIVHAAGSSWIGNDTGEQSSEFKVFRRGRSILRAGTAAATSAAATSAATSAATVSLEDACHFALAAHSFHFSCRSRWIQRYCVWYSWERDVMCYFCNLWNKDPIWSDAGPNASIGCYCEKHGTNWFCSCGDNHMEEVQMLASKIWLDLRF